MNKAAATVVGSAILALGALVLVWSLFGGMAKAYLPHELGYSHLGWVRAGVQTVWHVGIPKWAGPQGFLSAVQTPLRHRKVFLERGQKIIAAYDIRIERGQMTLSAYRTNLSRILQGARVEDFRYIRFRQPGRHVGLFEYAAPADGVYEFDYDIRWDKKANRGAVVPLPNYEMVYDIHWRLERN